MSAVKRHGSNLRDEYAALTRQRIVVAFVETLQDEAADDVSMAAVAKRAKVAERTIYRHFNTRAELLAAAGEWVEDNVFGYPTSCRTFSARCASASIAIRISRGRLP
jgi:AcrR family transcriptional regulator